MKKFIFLLILSHIFITFNGCKKSSDKVEKKVEKKPVKKVEVIKLNKKTPVAYPFDKPMQYYNQLIGKSSFDAANYSRLGQFENAIVEYEFATDIFEKILKHLQDEKEKLYDMGKTRHAIALIGPITETKINISKYKNLLGKQFFMLKNYDKAIEIFKNAKKVNKKFQDSYYNIAASLEMQSKFEEALKEYEEVRKLNVKSNTPNFFIAINHLKQKKYQSALTYLKVLHTRDYSNLEYRFNIGLCYFNLKNYDKAVEFFRKTLYIDQNFLDAYYYRAKANIELKKYKDALDDLIILNRSKLKFEHREMVTKLIKEVEGKLGKK